MKRGHPHVHRPGIDTEHLAFEKVEPTISSIKAAILQSLEGADFTPDEFAAERGMLINTIRRRFVDLWKEGRVRPTDERRSNSNGNLCVVWTLGRDSNAGETRAQQTAKRLAWLEERVVQLTAALELALQKKQ